MLLYFIFIIIICTGYSKGSITQLRTSVLQSENSREDRRNKITKYSDQTLYHGELVYIGLRVQADMDLQCLYQPSVSISQ